MSRSPSRPKSRNRAAALLRSERRTSARRAKERRTEPRRKSERRGSAGKAASAPDFKVKDLSLAG